MSNLIAHTLRTAGRRLRAAVRGLTGASNQWLRGEDPTTQSGATMQDALQQSAWVYACVRALAESVGNIPLRIVADTARERRLRHGHATRQAPRQQIVPSGPVVELFDQPHPDLTAFDFWELVIDWLMLRGRAFILATTDTDESVRIHHRGAGDPLPTRLYVLPSDRVIRMADDHETRYWYFNGSASDPLPPSRIEPDYLLLLRNPSPYNWWDGVAPYSAAAIASQSDFAAGAFMRGMMLNNADQGVIVSTDQWLSEEQREQINAALRERKRLAGTADRPMILGGGLKIERPPITVADLQFLENRRFSRQEICACFGVPEFILGYSEDANRSIGEEQRANFIEHRIAPLCARIDAKLGPLVQMFDPRYRAYHDVESHPSMVAVRRARIDSLVKLFNVGYPVNAANQWLDLDLPPVPWGDTGYLPFSVQPASAADQAPLAETEPADYSDTQARARQAAVNPFHRLGRAIAPAAPEDIHTCIGAEEYMASIRGSIKRKRGIVRRILWEQRGRVLAKLHSALHDQVKLAALVTVTRSLDDLWDADQEFAAAAARLNPALLDDLNFGGAQIWRELAHPGTFAVSPAEALKFLETRVNAIKGMNATTFDALRASLTEGLDAGDTWEQLANRVKDVFVAASDSRSETIATTETNIAINSGRFAGMTDAGVEKKSWLASRLSNVRQAHQQAARDYMAGIPLDQTFIVGGERLMHPGDPAGSPGNIINCRCSVLAVLADRVVQPLDRLSYEDWRAASSAIPHPTP